MKDLIYIHFLINCFISGIYFNEFQRDNTNKFGVMLLTLLFIALGLEIGLFCLIYAAIKSFLEASGIINLLNLIPLFTGRYDDLNSPAAIALLEEQILGYEQEKTKTLKKRTFIYTGKIAIEYFKKNAKVDKK